MRRSTSFRPALLVAAWLSFFAAASTFSGCEAAHLTANYYEKSCPRALSIIKAVLRSEVAKERRMAASLIRLHFHDCFVQGCDASILLKDSESIVSEQGVRQNFKSARGFEVIDRIKSALEKACPGVVSCADILAVAARDSSELVGGPKWMVKLGRRDSTTANKDLATRNLPLAFDDLPALIASFYRQGLSVRDMVALSGAHTIGQAQCVTYADRIHGDANIDQGFAATLRRRCTEPPPPIGSGVGDAPLDAATPYAFDNRYFQNLLEKKGLLHSDQALFAGGGGPTDRIVWRYSQNGTAFFEDFAAAMVRMGDLRPPAGSAGEVRKVCSVVNDQYHY